MKKQVLALLLGSAILSTSPAFAMETDELHHDPSTIRVTATTHFEHDGNEKPIKRITEMSEKELQDAIEKDISWFKNPTFPINPKLPNFAFEDLLIRRKKGPYDGTIMAGTSKWK